MAPVVLSNARHSGWKHPARETTFFRGLEQEKTKPLARAAKNRQNTAASHANQGLRRFIGKHQLNTIFAISTASLVWLQATAVLQTDLTKTA
ncbi:hypothetical protein D3C79_994900 [compost metagenome]